MRPSKTARLRLAWLLAVIALASACSGNVEGRPIAGPGAGPTEPSFPTHRPTLSPTPTTTTTPPPSPSTTAPPPPTADGPPGAVPLEPNDRGYVYIETKSGKTRCQISRSDVGCESTFENPPIKDGEPANGVFVTADGSLKWVVGNLGDIPVETLDYQTYTAQGWTIAASSSGTRFTNDRTGHGMYVSTENVESF